MGISGWTYPGWRGVFYPDDLPARRELAYAAARFDAIEINATRYRLQTPSFGCSCDETHEDLVVVAATASPRPCVARSATPSSFSTMTPRCGRPSTRWRSPHVSRLRKRELTP